MIKFAIVGVLGALVDYGIYILLTRLGSFDYLPARTISVMCAILNNFVWNKYWTFNRRKSNRMAVEYIRFLIVSILSMGLNLLIMYLIIEYIPVATLLEAYKDIFAMSIGIGAAFILNFYLNRHWTFS